MIRILLALALLIPAAIAATCKGEDPCKACKDCSQCKYCTSGKGSCGTCRNQSAEESRKRDRKRK